MISDFALELEILVAKWRKLGDDVGDMRDVLLEEAEHLAKALDES